MYRYDDQEHYMYSVILKYTVLYSTHIYVCIHTCIYYDFVGMRGAVQGKEGKCQLSLSLIVSLCDWFPADPDIHPDNSK